MANKGMAVFNQGGEDFTINDPNNAREFSEATGYKTGENVYYQGNLYRFNKAHPAGAWSASDVTQIKLADNAMLSSAGALEETDLNEVTRNGNYLMTDSHIYTNKPEGYDENVGFLQVINTGSWSKQILYAFVGDRIFMRTGNGNANGWRDWYTAANQYWNVKCLDGMADGTDLNDVMEPGVYLADSEYSYQHMPENEQVGYLIVYRAGTTCMQFFYTWTMQKLYTRKILREGLAWSDWITSNGMGTGLEEEDLNKATTAGWWILYDEHDYKNTPVGFGNLGFLEVIKFGGNWCLQILYQFSGGHIYKRRGRTDNTLGWETWQEISGSGGGNVYNITNEYSFPKEQNTYNVNASPEIRTDTNNYLASTGDTTDVTMDIAAMLEETGICRLGPGVFYVKNLDMPDGSAIIGSGYATEIHLIGTDDGYAVKMESHCMVKDLQIIGANTEPSIGENVGGRHGILWIGDYTESQTAPYRGIVSDVYIKNFSGGGITCYDTGYGTNNALEVTNVYIWSCSAGLNISYWSEFHKFTNVRCGNCYYGCVNNGGNNIFVNCDFSSNQAYAMIMDNSQGQSPNNTHGSAIGCVFNHTASGGTANAGIGIAILNCESGFVFEGCQIFFSRIHLEDSDGIVFMGCNFGLNNCDIEISGGGAIIFNGNMHQARPTITIDGNQNVKFVNCYTRNGAEIQP